jgi:hypothetical protein
LGTAGLGVTGTGADSGADAGASAGAGGNRLTSIVTGNTGSELCELPRTSASTSKACAKITSPSGNQREVFIDNEDIQGLPKENERIIMRTVLIINC